MKDPFLTLGIGEDADDDTVRQAYLQRVRAFPPDREPDRFQEIRAAYEALANMRDRMAYRLFQAPQPDVTSLLALLLEASTPTPPSEALFLGMLQESLQGWRPPVEKQEKTTC